MSSPNYLVPYTYSTTPSNTDQSPDFSTTPPGDAVTSPDLSIALPRDPTSKYSSITESREQEIYKLPAWMSKGKTSDAMTKCKKITTLEMNRENFNDQAIKGYYYAQYSTAWKADTT